MFCEQVYVPRTALHKSACAQRPVQVKVQENASPKAVCGLQDDADAVLIIPDKFAGSMELVSLERRILVGAEAQDSAQGAA